MIVHSPNLEDRLGQVTPVSSPLGNPGIPLTESHALRAQFRSAVGIPDYAARAGINDSGIAGQLLNADVKPFNEVL